MLMPHFIDLRKCRVILRKLRVFCVSHYSRTLRVHSQRLRVLSRGCRIIQLKLRVILRMVRVTLRNFRVIQRHLRLFAKDLHLFAINAQSLGARQKVESIFTGYLQKKRKTALISRLICNHADVTFYKQEFFSPYLAFEKTSLPNPRTDSMSHEFVRCTFI